MMIFNCTSKSQGRNREVGSEGNETANPRADGQKSRTRPRITKSTEEGFRVNEAVERGDLRKKRNRVFYWIPQTKQHVWPLFSEIMI